MSYGIPTYKLAKRPIVYFAGYQHHVSVYPATDARWRRSPASHPTDPDAEP